MRFDKCLLGVCFNDQCLADGLWGKVNAAQEDNPKLLSRPAYVELERHVGQCGAVEFAQASVAVPFVGAAAGALVIASAIRLASLQASPLFLQMGLGAPEMTRIGGFARSPETNLGSFFDEALITEMSNATKESENENINLASR